MTCIKKEPSKKKTEAIAIPLKNTLDSSNGNDLGGFSLVLAHRVSTLQTRLAAANQVVELAMIATQVQMNRLP